MFIFNNKSIPLIYKGNELKMVFPKYWTPSEPSEPSEPSKPFEYWEPPIQPSSVYNPYTYEQLIAEYDDLMAKEPTYITKYKYDKNTLNGNYELYHYILEPPSYSKTIYIQTGIHGNEMDGKQQLLRVVDILVNKTDEVGYERFKNIRNDCRLIIVPCVSPYGHSKGIGGMNIPYIYNDTEYGINLNRNYDFNQQWALDSPGVGGNEPFEMIEIQHTRDIIEKIGVENIDYAMDWHDGGDVKQHYWINYAVDGNNRKFIDDFVKHLVKKYNIENPIIGNCKDTNTTGIAMAYFSKTLGLMASTVEWIGGYLGYDFSSSQMTQSIEIRGNMLLMAYENDLKGWKVDEPTNSQYFHFDYPKAFTRKSLRYDGADERTIVTDYMIYDRWNKLQLKYPNLISKSAQLGTNPYGQDCQRDGHRL